MVDAALALMRLNMAEREPQNKQNVSEGFMRVGNAAGYPGVFRGNPHPYPWKPTPSFRGAGFPGVSHGFSKTPGIPKPVRVWEHSNVVLILYN